jgi:hypothetical protein
VINRPVELTDLYPILEIVVARAGRNATVLVPIAADPHRGGEQLSNAAAVQGQHIRAITGWADPDAVENVLRWAIRHATTDRRGAGLRGNNAATRFIASVIAPAHDAHTVLSV